MQEYQQEYADHWYMEPSALQQAGGVWIVRAGRNIAKPHYFVGPKIIELYSLHFVVEGRVKLLYGDHEAVELEAGDLYCLFPHQPYTYYSLSEDRPAVRLHWLAMDGPQLPQILSGIGMTVALPYARGILTAEAQTSGRKGYSLRYLIPPNTRFYCRAIYITYSTNSSSPAKTIGAGLRIQPFGFRALKNLSISIIRKSFKWRI